MRFRKKPVEIEAIQWDGTNLGEIFDFMQRPGDLISGDDWDGELVIYTLEGDLTAQPGDWIIRGIQGEFYPCKPDIFLATYEPVEDSDG